MSACARVCVYMCVYACVSVCVCMCLNRKLIEFLRFPTVNNYPGNIILFQLS